MQRSLLAALIALLFSADIVANCNPAGTWSGGTPSGWSVDAQLAVDGARATAVVDLPDAGGFGRRFTGTVDGCRVHLERPQPAGRPPVVLDGTVRGDTLSGELQLFGVKAPVTLQRRATPIAQPREENVTFRSGDVALAGTVMLPERPGTYAAVVFTHGGGAETRSTTQSLATYLARRGVASLVYDKRGTGESTGEWQIASMEELARDAVAGVALLRTRTDIDASRIGVFGYSQGGWIAPLAATLDPRIAFVIAGGLSAVNPMENTIHHRTHVMRQEHFDTETIRNAMSLWRELYAAESAEARRTIQEKLTAASSAPWFAAAGLPPEIDPDPPASMIDFLRFDPIPVWAAVRQPAYLYWGAADINVPVRETMRTIAAVAGTNDLTMRLHPGLAHDLRLPSADLPRFSRAATHEEIAQWLARYRPPA